MMFLFRVLLAVALAAQLTPTRSVRVTKETAQLHGGAAPEEVFQKKQAAQKKAEAQAALCDVKTQSRRCAQDSKDRKKELQRLQRLEGASVNSALEEL